MKDSYVMKHEHPSFEKRFREMKRKHQADQHIVSSSTFNIKSDVNTGRDGQSHRKRLSRGFGGGSDIENVAVVKDRFGSSGNVGRGLQGVSNMTVNEPHHKDNQNKTKISGSRPAARDGHSGVVIGFNYFVFGGDRHHNPFNDLYILDLLAEFDEQGLIEFDDY